MDVIVPEGGVKPNKVLPFGKHEGRKLCDCSSDYLEWMSKNLLDTDRAPYAVTAAAILKERGDDRRSFETELDADAFLLKHGCGDLVPRRKRKRRA